MLCLLWIKTMPSAGGCQGFTGFFIQLISFLYSYSYDIK